VRIPGRLNLLQESWQVSSVLRREEVATPGKQATDAHRILGYFIAPHGTIAFFDPPANGPLTGIIGVTIISGAKHTLSDGVPSEATSSLRHRS
jgi:hypothetical protein